MDFDFKVIEPKGIVMMRTMVKGSWFIALGVAALLPRAVSAQTEVTANAGWVSQYYYRGIPQKTSSANAGLDVAAPSFSAGTWAADVGDGSEIDLYAAVGIPVSDAIDITLGGTGYFYTGNFDVTYLEGNLGVALGPVSIEWSAGSHQYDPQAAKYSFLGLTVEQRGLFATVGSFSEANAFGDAFSDMFTFDVPDNPEAGIHGQYLEAGYGFSAADLDFVISGIWNDSEISNQGSDELTFVFGVSKTFTLGAM